MPDNRRTVALQLINKKARPMADIPDPLDDHITLMVRTEMQSMWDGMPDSHKEAHRIMDKEIVPFIRIQIERAKRRDAMFQKLKEQTFLWGLLSGLAYIGHALWQHTFGE